MGIKLSENQDYINSVTDQITKEDLQGFSYYTQDMVWLVLKAMEREAESRESDRTKMDKLIMKAQQPILDHAKACKKCKGRTSFSIITRCDTAYAVYLDTLYKVNGIKDGI